MIHSYASLALNEVVGWPSSSDGFRSTGGAHSDGADVYAADPPVSGVTYGADEAVMMDLEFTMPAAVPSLLLTLPTVTCCPSVPWDNTSHRETIWGGYAVVAREVARSSLRVAMHVTVVNGPIASAGSAPIRRTLPASTPPALPYVLVPSLSTPAKK